MEPQYFTKDDALKIAQSWEKLRLDAMVSFISDDLFEGSSDILLTPAKHEAIMDFFVVYVDLYHSKLIETVIATDSFRNLDLESSVQIRREIQSHMEAQMSDFVDFIMSRIILEHDPVYQTHLRALKQDLLDLSKAHFEYSLDKLMTVIELALSITRIGRSQNPEGLLKAHQAKQAVIERRTNLSVAIEASGFTQAYFVEKTGIDKKNFSQYVSGKSRPSVKNKKAIAKALADAMKREISVGMLFGANDLTFINHQANNEKQTT